MAELVRVKARWQNYQGGPGYSVFHFGSVAPGLDLQTMTENSVERVAVFFQSIRMLLPYQLQIQTLNEVDIIDSASGDLLEVRASAAKPAIISGGTASDNFAAAVGAVVTWRTGGVRNGRRVKGRTFLVPLNGTQFENNGTLRQTAIDTISNNADELYTDTFSVVMGVYARPTSSTASDGAFHPITSHSVPDMGAVLRSRRQ